MVESYNLNVEEAQIMLMCLGCALISISLLILRQNLGKSLTGGRGCWFVEPPIFQGQLCISTVTGRAFLYFTDMFLTDVVFFV